jgi:hypothetical protein
MSTFKDRLNDEKTQLDEKIDKLEIFISGKDFRKVDPIQKSLLKSQLLIMKTYSQILTERLSYL